MLHFVTDLFGYAGFPPRWRAAGWQRAPAVGWAHVLADFALFAAFLVTACALAYVVLRRRDLPFQRVAWLFCLVFMAGGVVYLLDALAFWLPFYHVAAVIKLFTAVLAWFAVLALLPLLAYALVVASPASRAEQPQETSIR